MDCYKHFSTIFFFLKIQVTNWVRGILVTFRNQSSLTKVTSGITLNSLLCSFTSIIFLTYLKKAYAILFWKLFFMFDCCEPEEGCCGGRERMVVGFIDTKVVSPNPTHGKVQSIHHYEIKFVSDLRQVCRFLRVLWVSSINKTDCHDITEILLSGVKHHNSYSNLEPVEFSKYVCFIRSSNARPNNKFNQKCDILPEI